MTTKAWRSFSEVRDEIGKDRFLVQLREGRWSVVWTGRYATEHYVPDAYWFDETVDGWAMTQGNILGGSNMLYVRPAQVDSQPLKQHSRGRPPVIMIGRAPKSMYAGAFILGLIPSRRRRPTSNGGWLSILPRRTNIRRTSGHTPAAYGKC
jgi:hypothetical protein